MLSAIATQATLPQVPPAIRKIADNKQTLPQAGVASGGYLGSMSSKPENPGYRALRSGRVSLRGQIYLVTTTTPDRQARFANADAAQVLCRYLYAPGSLLDARLLAWVLMPDHWHGLIELQQSSLSSAMRRFKSGSARAMHRWHPEHGAVWAAGFHDHALRAEENLLGCARYIVLNPVRAGLVKRVGDYPYWNAIWL